MKVLYIFVICFLISTVNCDSEKIIKTKRSIGEDEFTANEDEEFDEILEDIEPVDNNQQVQREIICPEVSDVLSTATSQNIEFKITFPESIRYMEVSKVEVMIYNRMNSSEPLDVEVSIQDNSKFQFFNSKCNSSSMSKSEFTKIITVPHGLVQSFSFYIQATGNSKQSSDFSNFVLKASIKNENYECYLTKGVKIVPAKIKTYNVDTRSYNLKSSEKTNEIALLTKNREDRITRIYVEIIADQTIKSNFSIALTNEKGFSEIVHGTDLTDTPIEIMFPENTTNAKTTIKGSGLCTIAIITEQILSISNPRSHFNLKITPLSSLSENEAIVRVCATYYHDEEFLGLKNLLNVIYDVEMPSGYVYKEVVDISQKQEIKLAQPRWKNSSVQVYFNDFERDENYCVDIRAIKMKESSNVADAAVIVYDYNDKKNLATGYYNFNGEC